MYRYLQSYSEPHRVESICSRCRGFRKLCGRSICPILVKAKSTLEVQLGLEKKELFGASPPSIFIGSWGYPRVYIGPLTPPIEDRDTSIMDSPWMWLNLNWEDILRYRILLFRGKRPYKVSYAKEPDRYVEALQEVAMSVKPVDTEIEFAKKPKLRVRFWIHDPPTGPSGPVENLEVVENPRVPRTVDKVVYDTDLKANEALWSLYLEGFNTRYLMRLLSIGLLGIKNYRRLVPTEWSITAVDSNVGDRLLRDVRSNPIINYYYIYGFKALGNNIQILFIPEVWMYEALESWLIGSDPHISGDHEVLRRRSSYANNIGGAYYAARLPILDHLYKLRRQAAAIVFIEVYPEWIPIGVWRIREIVREALRGRGLKATTLEEAIDILRDRLRISIGRWLSKSYIYRLVSSQDRLDRYIRT